MLLGKVSVRHRQVIMRRYFFAPVQVFAAIFQWHADEFCQPLQPAQR
jgi:hypothetical protein